MVVFDVRRWASNVKKRRKRKEKNIMDTLGRTPALNNEAKSYIKSLISTDKPESSKNIIKLTQDWL